MNTKRRELLFQNKASNIAIEWLQEKKKFSFQSPTGSGKTLITGMMIEKYLSNPIFAIQKTSFIFIAPSVGGLDYQGYQKISGYLEKDWIKGFDTEYIGTGGKKSKGQYLQNIDKFVENTAYFIGWSLFGKNSNLTNIDSERNNLFRVIENTKKDNINVVLIIDEAHREVKKINSETKKAALGAINPIKTIEISATLDNPDYSITLKEVREEAAIKKNVIVDTGQILEGNLDSKGEIEQLISVAIQKQNAISEAYFKRDISNRPLILIQIPDKQKVGKLNTDDYYLSKVKTILNDKGYVEGQNYVIWLSEEKTIKEKDSLTAFNSPIEVLIFKQAIATGWDLPRANILIRLREPKSAKFDIQTLGRILRNPFFKYYNNQLIDNAFVFTKDTRYTYKILQEKFITMASSRKLFPRSAKSKKSDLKLNKILFQNEIDEDKLIDQVSTKAINKIQNIFNQHGKKIIKDYDSNSSFSFELETSRIDDLEKTKEIAKRNVQKSLFPTKAKENLFTIYLKYKFIFKGKEIESKIMDEIANKLSPAIKKKHFYKFVTKGDSHSYYDSLNIKEYITKLKNKYIKAHSEKFVEEYLLPNDFEYSTNFAKDGWDNANTYELKADSKEQDSTIETDFYNMLKNTFALWKHIHIFRNGVNESSFQIDYFNKVAKKSKFFPDFMLINEKYKKVLILETKGRNEQDIDKHSDLKFRTAWDYLKEIENNYEVSIYKVTKQKNDEWEFTFNNSVEQKTLVWKKFLCNE